LQILRYDYGQKYGAHYDSLGRICTVLVYLTDAEEGGETAFPKTSDGDWADVSQRSTSTGFSDCARGHVAAKPKKGDALLFYSLKPDGQTTDDMAMHTGCPLIKGIKWTATIWMHPTVCCCDALACCNTVEAAALHLCTRLVLGALGPVHHFATQVHVPWRRGHISQESSLQALTAKSKSTLLQLEWAIGLISETAECMQPFRPDDFHHIMRKRQESGVYEATPGVLDRKDDPGVCMDVDSRCVEWAKSGECTKNPGYMTGADSENVGACRLACQTCQKCAEDDNACYFENRSKAGYLHLADEVKKLTNRDLPAQF
jgi:2OG-Fe(II) oxygenase superfamily